MKKEKLTVGMRKALFAVANEEVHYNAFYGMEGANMHSIQALASRGLINSKRRIYLTIFTITDVGRIVLDEIIKSDNQMANKEEE